MATMEPEGPEYKEPDYEETDYEEWSAQAYNVTPERLNLVAGMIGPESFTLSVPSGEPSGFGKAWVTVDKTRLCGGSITTGSLDRIFKAGDIFHVYRAERRGESDDYDVLDMQMVPTRIRPPRVPGQAAPRVDVEMVAHMAVVGRQKDNLLLSQDDGTAPGPRKRRFIAFNELLSECADKFSLGQVVLVRWARTDAEVWLAHVVKGRVENERVNRVRTICRLFPVFPEAEVKLTFGRQTAENWPPHWEFVGQTTAAPTRKVYINQKTMGLSKEQCQAMKEGSVLTMSLCPFLPAFLSGSRADGEFELRALALVEDETDGDSLVAQMSELSFATEFTPTTTRAASLASPRKSSESAVALDAAGDESVELGTRPLGPLIPVPVFYWDFPVHDAGDLRALALFQDSNDDMLSKKALRRRTRREARAAAAEDALLAVGAEHSADIPPRTHRRPILSPDSGVADLGTPKKKREHHHVRKSEPPE